jgi:hypothetical protein
MTCAWCGKVGMFPSLFSPTLRPPGSLKHTYIDVNTTYMVGQDIEIAVTP